KAPRSFSIDCLGLVPNRGSIRCRGRWRRPLNLSRLPTGRASPITVETNAWTQMAMYLKVDTVADVERYMDRLRTSARRAQDRIRAKSGDPLDFLRSIKFDPIGCHPIEDRGINLIEQINQTWTFAVALAAARQLLVLHPDVGGFHLAPGAHMSIPLDIMSKA